MYGVIIVHMDFFFPTEVPRKIQKRLGFRISVLIMKLLIVKAMIQYCFVTVQKKKKKKIFFFNKKKKKKKKILDHFVLTGKKQGEGGIDKHCRQSKTN